MAEKSAHVFFYLLLAGGVVSGFTPVTYPVSSECGQYDSLQDQHLMETLGQVQQQLDCHPSKNRSCQEILHCFPSAPSGYYQIRVPNGSLVQVYCDMEGTKCGGEGGWTRVAYVNMSQSGATCPQGLTQTTLSGLTLCGRNAGPEVLCQSTVFSTLGLNYTRVCGQLRGYQYIAPDAFGAYNLNPSQSLLSCSGSEPICSGGCARIQVRQHKLFSFKKRAHSINQCIHMNNNDNNCPNTLPTLTWGQHDKCDRYTVHTYSIVHECLSEQSVTSNLCGDS